MGEENLEVILGAKRPTNTKLLSTVSPFYASIMQTWMTLHNFSPEDEQGVRGEVLWDNSRISSPRAMLRADAWRPWIEAGIITVHHLCHPVEDRLLGQQEISDKFGVKCNFLQALRIRSSFPHNWRKMLTVNFQEQVATKYHLKINNVQFDLMTSNPKQWYVEEARSKGHTFNREGSWDKELNLGDQNTDLDWNAIFTSPYKVTRETKMQSFAFKIAYRITPCNVYLHKIRIKDSPICTFCEDRDTITHFFYECTAVKPLWRALNHWCMSHLDLGLNDLTKAEVLLGVHKPLRQQKLINWILLYVKFYILRKKLFHEAEISLIELLAEFRLKLLTERRACIWENRIRKFKCWERFLRALG